MKTKIVTSALALSILTFAAGYYTAYKRESVTDEQLKEFFDRNVAITYINMFYQNDVSTTYQIAKTLQSYRDEKTLNPSDFERLESVIKENEGIFNALYKERPEGPVMNERIRKQIEFIKSYRIKYISEKP